MLGFNFYWEDQGECNNTIFIFILFFINFKLHSYQAIAERGGFVYKEYKQIKFIDFVFIVDKPRGNKFIIFVCLFRALEHLLECSSVFFITYKCRSPPSFKFQKILGFIWRFNMKSNDKCFIKLNKNEYEEITYKELIERRKNLKEYRDKRFIKLDNVLLEVSKDEYRKIDLEDQREKYVGRLKNKYRTISLDKVYADNYTLKDVIPDSEEDLADKIQRKIEIEKIQRALLMLSDKEYKLIKVLFFDQNTLRESAQILGKHWTTIEEDRDRILAKLKKIIKN